MRSALYEDWTEDSMVLRLCILRGTVEFDDLCTLLGDLIVAINSLVYSVNGLVSCKGYC